MSDAVLPIQLRNKVAIQSYWESANPLIEPGEICVEKVHTNAEGVNLKIGNNANYIDTPYFGILGCGTNLSTISCTNLNQLITPGSYYANSPNDEGGIELSNGPSDLDEFISNGRRIIKVFSNINDNSLLTQIIFPASGAANGFFIRNGSYSNNNWSWSIWKENFSQIAKVISYNFSGSSTGVKNETVKTYVFGNANTSNDVTYSGYYMCTVRVTFNKKAGQSGTFLRKIRIMSSEEEDDIPEVDRADEETIFDNVYSVWETALMENRNSIAYTRNVSFLKSTDISRGIVIKVWQNSGFTLSGNIQVNILRLGPVA